MTDSNITKLALSNALKELLEEQPLEKISVSEICDKCHMNRKSFYYHFRDKFDLVNWIFDKDIIQLNQMNSIGMQGLDYDFDAYWKNIEIICQYFYDNRTFYRRVLKADGPNSFHVHFRDFFRPLLQHRVEQLLGQDVSQMVYDFILDGVICSIVRWLMDKNCVSAEEHVENLKTLFQLFFVDLKRRVSVDPKWME